MATACRQRRCQAKSVRIKRTCCHPIPANAGDQASAKGEDLRRTVIGAVRAPAEQQVNGLEAWSRSGRQGRRFRQQHSMSGRPAHGQAHACISLVIAATTAVAAARSMIDAISRDGHLRRHHAALHERQAHPERQQERQEERADPMAKAAAHSAAKMATLGLLSKTRLKA